jgi:hypothetical protein
MEHGEGVFDAWTDPVLRSRPGVLLGRWNVLCKSFCLNLGQCSSYVKRRSFSGLQSGADVVVR